MYISLAVLLLYIICVLRVYSIFWSARGFSSRTVPESKRKRERRTRNARLATMPALVLSCGSFSPPTVMHCLMMETARNHAVHALGERDVIGVVSPVNDAYRASKPGLVAATHRVEMLRHALQRSAWVHVNTWESEQARFVRSHEVVSHVRAQLAKNAEPASMRVLFVCGTDVAVDILERRGWPEDSVQALLSKAELLIMPRPPSPAAGDARNVHQAQVDLHQLVHEDVRNASLASRIHVLTDAPVANISSTLARRMLRRGYSVKYVLDESVRQYIEEHGLYGRETDAGE
ncbi:Nicotinamide/nicotinic acid mononucleotide adenylyltransferase 3 [Porphyridium purpureum]|uniref:Nicotinamide-nucleotide adenylyltransferase n=1 Tax=Porphyridium purpureum TaxID=35688 RepID=A0A5J4Z0R6_PORPP|nr:Nicotinamide/nicotinic acid mononucleotide adenylyltransferase 3 [Porphyridium purpureum]|eukprot:POR4810..scf208_2